LIDMLCSICSARSMRSARSSSTTWRTAALRRIIPTDEMSVASISIALISSQTIAMGITARRGGSNHA
jgi:hypothetical protein